MNTRELVLLYTYYTLVSAGRITFIDVIYFSAESWKPFQRRVQLYPTTSQLHDAHDHSCVKSEIIQYILICIYMYTWFLISPTNYYTPLFSHRTLMTRLAMKCILTSFKSEFFTLTQNVCQSILIAMLRKWWFQIKLTNNRYLQCL